MFWKLHLFSQNIRKRRRAVLALKRCRSVEHLINQNPQRPPIHSAGVSAALNHLWGNVLFSADERVGSKIGDARLRVDRGQR